MKKFTIPCDFAEAKAPFNIYIGEPSPKFHPLQFQHLWLQEERGGSIPSEIMDSFQKLHAIALENGASFEELCVYALGTTSEKASGEAKKDEQ
ncbi:DUF2610 domain-containing protein [Ktedonospora formicarum]|uniref:DUF2610 domain-containing protein n=1 Tax=Ktedonospora formicarum TaxID=2778364 RepID=A0A8J3I1V4_9CHLR|nr:DUF2610 domain-containing protein [Ktedonospora formicarum]GHO46066.1 hypothetical protein KSX_42290 [Ktedonospora formicarum]